jgi:hypothetical protein
MQVVVAAVLGPQKVAQVETVVVAQVAALIQVTAVQIVLVLLM